MTPAIALTLTAAEKRINYSPLLAPGLNSRAAKAKADCDKSQAAVAGLKREHERHQVFLFLGVQLQFENEVKELHGVIQRQGAVVMQIWG